VASFTNVAVAALGSLPGLFPNVLARSAKLRQPVRPFLIWVEAVMFGLPVATVFVGFMEMVTREKAGIVRAKPAA